MSPPVMAGLVSVCSLNRSWSPRRPLRAADAERSMSRDEGGVGTTSSSSRTILRSRSSDGALRATKAAGLDGGRTGALVARTAFCAVRVTAFEAAFLVWPADALRARAPLADAFRERACVAVAAWRACFFDTLAARACRADALRRRAEAPRTRA